MMRGEEMKGGVGWWKNIPEEQKKAFLKAKLDFKIKKVQTNLEFLKELQKIFG